MSGYELVIIPLIVVIVAQIIKIVIAKAKRKRWEWKMIKNYGGMPSAHTAFVTSLVTIITIQEGTTSPLFAIAMVFSIIIIWDAMGIRYKLGQHGKILNMLIKDLPAAQEIKYPANMEEQLGHTPLEAFVGIIVGVVLTFLLNPLF